MRVSAFTFLRNAQQLGFPFLQSIDSVLPLVDEFVINVGRSEDNTLEQIKAIKSSKIRIIESCWNDTVTDRGFVYAQQKMIAQYSCTGDWAFYLEADEVIHEQDHDKIHQAMSQYLQDARVEVLLFDYLHFYGNQRSLVWSPSWYRRAPRIIKTSVRNYAPDGLFWVVVDKNNKKGRYPRAALTGATIYHYGWVRQETKMQQKYNQVAQYWGLGDGAVPKVSYAAIDSATLHEFCGTHPAVMQDFFPEANALFEADPQHRLTSKERKNRLRLQLERWFKADFSKKHYQLVS